MAAYATRADLYTYGLPRGLLVEERRLISDVDTTNDRFSLANHGLALDQVVELVEDQGGTLPSPLATATVYYAKPVDNSESLLQLAATAGGAAINLTTAGTGTFGLYIPINSILDAALEFASREFDMALIGHEVQLTAPYPVVAVGIVAKLAAKEALDRIGRKSETVDEMAERARGQMRQFLRGLSLRDANATDGANDAEAWGDDLRGWQLEDGRIL